MSKKNTIANINNTIDNKHNEMIEKFDNIETTIIPELKKEKEELIHEIRSLSKKEVDKYMELKDRILEIKSNIKKLKNEKKNIILKTAHIYLNILKKRKKFPPVKIIKI